MEIENRKYFEFNNDIKLLKAYNKKEKINGVGTASTASAVLRVNCHDSIRLFIISILRRFNLFGIEILLFELLLELLIVKRRR